MEAVRQPKSKTRSRADSNLAPTQIRDERTVVQGSLLPNVPREEPGAEQNRREVLVEESPDTVETREECHSPEPEELFDIPQEEPCDATTLPYGTTAVESAASVAVPEIYPTLESTDAEVLQEAIGVYPKIKSLADDVVELANLEEEQAFADWSGLAHEEEKKDRREDGAHPIMNGLETTELGLLSEEILLCFYHNALYEDTEQLVDRFCVEELDPIGPLRKLLQRFKGVCEELDKAQVKGSATAFEVEEKIANLWSSQPRIHEHVHTCDEHNRASGTAKYEIAVMNKEKLEEIKKLLAVERDVKLKKEMCLEIEARSIALQTQWIIGEVITTFNIETDTSPTSTPTLLPPPPLNAHPSYARGVVHSALSDLFTLLRTQNMSKRCAEAVQGWVTELVSVFHKSFLATDGLWLLSHVLRLPSPCATWTCPLIQNFMQSNSSDKLKLDYCVAMISLLMSPIKSREQFLSDFASVSVPGNSAHADDESPLIISESDLTSLLEQLPVADFYTLAIRHFMATHAKTVDQFTSLIAFQLLLMKIFFVGLEEYSAMKYKAFCKQIGMALRKSVRELGCQWKAVRSLLEPAADYQLQKEMDRIVLLAVNYITVNKSLGLWQYLIDLPYDCISEGCRMRVEYLLRRGGDADCRNSRELFSMQPEDIVKKMRASTLADRLSTSGEHDTLFLVQALTGLVVQTSQDPTAFLREIVQVCFVDETTRASLYKAGRESIATVLKARPSCLDALINVIDRSIDHIEAHLMDIFASAPLHMCKISESTVGGVIGKWLIGRSPETPGNRVARRILSGMNWGYGEDGELWMHKRVHVMCADIVVKAHIAHCSSGILGNIAQMAYGTQDHYANFSQFCWQILVKLKLPIQASSKQPDTEDLADHFVHAAQYSLSSADYFALTGLNCVDKLVTAGCTSAATVLMSRSLLLYYERAHVITEHENFLPVFERLIHADQSSYAYQLLAGPPTSPSQVAKCLECAITYEARQVSNISLYLRAWIDALVVKRAVLFRTDQVSLQLLGTIARLAFEEDPSTFLGIIDQLQAAHKQILTVWDESSQSYLTMLTGATPPPPLIPSSHLHIAPWASFVCLCAEENTFSSFHDTFYQELGLGEITVAIALQRASSKYAYSLPMERLAVFRWMELCRGSGFKETEQDAQRDAPLLALALQRFALAMFTPRISQGKKYQLAGKLYASAKEQFNSFIQLMESRNEPNELPKAVAGWIKAADDLSSPSFSEYPRGIQLVYILCYIISENRSIGMDLVDRDVIVSQNNKDYEQHASTIHGIRRKLSSVENRNNAYQRAPMRTRGSRALPFPSIPDRSSVPRPPPLDRSSLGNGQSATRRVNPLISCLSVHADKLEHTSKTLEEKDREYCEMLRQLHVPAKVHVEVVVRCSEECQGTAARSVKVNGTMFNTTNAVAKDENRKERSSVIDSCKREELDDAAFKCATIELIARKVMSIGSSPDSRAQNILHVVGRTLFDLINSSLSSAPSLRGFPPAIASFNQVLQTISSAPMLTSPDEHLSVLAQVLSGSQLSEGLAYHFDPAHLTPKLLLEAYKRCVNTAVRQGFTQTSFVLLSRFSTSGFSSISSEDIQSLMPVILCNARAAIAGGEKAAEPLQQIFVRHVVDFAFLRFPENIIYGLNLALKGVERGTAPPALLKEYVESFAKHAIDSKTLMECATITADFMKKVNKSTTSKCRAHREALSGLMQILRAKPVENSNEINALEVLQDAFDDLASV